MIVNENDHMIDKNLDFRDIAVNFSVLLIILWFYLVSQVCGYVEQMK
jgi:hypothetical protein